VSVNEIIVIHTIHSIFHGLACDALYASGSTGNDVLAENKIMQIKRQITHAISARACTFIQGCFHLVYVKLKSIRQMNMEETAEYTIAAHWTHCSHTNATLNTKTLKRDEKWIGLLF